MFWEPTVIKLSDNEKAILSRLQFRARVSHAEVARDLGLNSNTVLRVIDRLCEREILTPVMRVNVHNMNVELHAVWFKYSALGAGNLPKVREVLLGTREIKALDTVSGEFNLVARVAVRDSHHLDELMERLTSACLQYFSRVCWMRDRYWYNFERHPTTNEGCSASAATRVYRQVEVVDLDPLDFTLIDSLAKNPLISQRELASRLNVPPQTLNDRVGIVITESVVT
jgi:DNA-binding Lrp family transcriptional regulator